MKFFNIAFLFITIFSFSASVEVGAQDFLDLQNQPNCENCQPPAPNRSSLVGNMAKTLSEAVAFLPDGEIKHSLQTYLRIIKPELYTARDNKVGESNAGLSQYLSNRFKEPQNYCFREAAVKFYKEINQLSGQSALSPQRPHLLTEAGKSPYESYPPGWLWKLALSHTNGNPNAAVLLIGLCGHDDMSQGFFTYLEKNIQFAEQLRAQNEILKSDIAAMQRSLKNLALEKKRDAKQIRHLQETINMSLEQIEQNEQLIKVGGMPRKLNCPDSKSPFYMPKSLGGSVDISDELRNEIKAIQGKGKELAVIPAKHYHILGSALIACQMIEKGVSPSTTTKIQTTAAQIYRGIRMCETSSSLLQEREQLISAYNRKNQIGRLNLNADLRFEESLSNLAEEFDKDRQMCDHISLRGFKEAFCKVFGLLPFQSSQAKGSLRQKILYRTMRMDSAFLYKRWYLGGGEVFDQKIPCTDLRIGGPFNLMKPESITGRLDKPIGWSSERYNKATRHLATWDIDFTWTVAQHQVGSEFAAQNCKPQTPSDSSFCAQGSKGLLAPPQEFTPRRGVSSENPPL